MADDFTIEKPWTNADPADKTDDAVPRWDKSDLRKYLNDEFYNTLSDNEKALVKETSLETQDAATTWSSAGIEPATLGSAGAKEAILIDS